MLMVSYCPNRVIPLTLISDAIIQISMVFRECLPLFSSVADLNVPQESIPSITTIVPPMYSSYVNLSLVWWWWFPIAKNTLTARKLLCPIR